MDPSSTVNDNFVPVYDVIPEEWDESRNFLTERLKEMTNAINVRQTGYFIDLETLAGENFIPSANVSPPQFRQVFRKVVDCSPLVGGIPRIVAHGIKFDVNFTLLHMYAGATNSVSLLAEPIPNGADTLSMTATNIIINSAASYDRCFVTIEYILQI